MKAAATCLASVGTHKIINRGDSEMRLTPRGEIVKGYKATDNNMQCRGYQFELGVWHKHDGDVVMCESGFHFCEYPSGPWAFYGGNNTRVFEVEARSVLKGGGPGADLKHVAMEIQLIREITIAEDCNAGYGNAGNGNTGDRNYGYWNTGHGNTGDWNTGDRNTGHGNTGHRNTGHRNTGDGNSGNGHSGDLCWGEAPYLIFNEPAKRTDVDRILVEKLALLLTKDEEINTDEFLSLPNATTEAIRTLHAEHIAARNSARTLKKP